MTKGWVSKRALLVLACWLGCPSAFVSAQPTAATPAEETLVLRPPSAADDAALLRELVTHADNFGRSCQPLAVAARARLRWVACGPAGVWVVRVSDDGVPSVIATQELGGSASGFFVRNARLWVELNTQRALDLGVAETAPPGVEPNVPPPPKAAAQPAPALPRRLPRPLALEAHVVGVLEGGVLIETGHADLDLMPGTRLAFFSGDVLERPEPIAVGRVVSVSGRRARVELGTDELVGSDARVQVTASEVSRSAFAPPRAAGMWEIAFLARPFLADSELGAGAVLDASVGYRFRFPLHIEASLAPLAIGIATAKTVVPFAGLLSAMFDSRVFEIGLGVGAQTVNDPPFAIEHGSGLTIAQRVRIGARDGANLTVSTYAVLFHSEFHFSDVRASLQIPVAARAWLLAAGGGGLLGIEYGEVGMRFLLSGNGGAGSFFLSMTVGGVNVFEKCSVLDNIDTFVPSCTATSYSGPMLGAGGEWRL